jgi:hypothetical protein
MPLLSSRPAPAFFDWEVRDNAENVKLELEGLSEDQQAGIKM